MTKYTHLCTSEREVLYVLLNTGKGQKEVAKVLGRNPSTISREIRRNRSLLKSTMNNDPNMKARKESYHYLPDRAQKKTEGRRKEANQRSPLKTLELYKYVVEELRKGTTPELISGRARLEQRGDISHECIYQYIYSLRARHLRLWTYLPRGHRKRKRKIGGRKQKRTLIPNRVDISLRPEIVNTRREFGHWEGDSVVGVGKKAAVNTNRERVSRYVLFHKIAQKTAEQTSVALITCFQTLPERARRSLTLDNGTEFTQHEQVTQKTGMKTYFARPYHSWERGSNENGNGLLRRFFPKGTDFTFITQAQLTQVQDWANHRPMKCLNYHTPHEIFHSLLYSSLPPQKIALAS